jgi:hypothetical protein
MKFLSSCLQMKTLTKSHDASAAASASALFLIADGASAKMNVGSAI